MFPSATPQRKQRRSWGRYSVKKCSVSTRISPDAAANVWMLRAACNDFVARGCLEHLHHHGSPGVLTDDTLAASRRVRHSAEFWIEHARARGESDECVTMSLRF